MYTEKIENTNIAIRAIPSTEYVLNGILNKIYVMVEVEVARSEQKTQNRADMELSIVLDRSGSMGGKKIEYSRIAVNKVIENLSKNDVLHFVVYDDKIDTVFQNGKLSNKDMLMKQVNSVHARGMTNLAGGVTRGHELIDSSKENKKSKRIFLFSDGLANVGPSSIPEVSKLIKSIYSKGINVSAFGIGDDFSEDMMKGIAEHGMGDYFFIEEADGIPAIVGEALDGLLGIEASNAKLVVRGINGATVTKIYNYEMTGALLGDLREDENRQVLIEVEIKPELLNEAKEFLSMELKYNHIDDLLADKSFKGMLPIKTTDDEEKIMEENEEILVLRKLLEASDQEDRLIEHLDRGEYDQAISLQNSIISELEKVNKLDKKGIIKEKLTLSRLTLTNLVDGKKRGDMRRSRKSAHYSAYQSKSSKKRRR